MTFLTISASIHGLKPECGENGCQPTPSQTSIFFVALYLIALGTGGIKPCVFSSVLINLMKVMKRKSSFFNWFYLSINIGALIASSFLVWIQMNVGWSLGLGFQPCLWPLQLHFFLWNPFVSATSTRRESPNKNCSCFCCILEKNSRRSSSDKSLLYEISDMESDIQGSRKLEHTEKFRDLSENELFWPIPAFLGKLAYTEKLLVLQFLDHNPNARLD